MLQSLSQILAYYMPSDAVAKFSVGQTAAVVFAVESAVNFSGALQLATILLSVVSSIVVATRYLSAKINEVRATGAETKIKVDQMHDNLSEVKSDVKQNTQHRIKAEVTGGK